VEVLDFEILCNFCIEIINFFFFFESNGMYFNTGLKGDLNRSPYFTYTCRLPDFTSEPRLHTSKQHDYANRNKKDKESPYHNNKAEKLTHVYPNNACATREDGSKNKLDQKSQC
jgi:hypothetical protein